MPQWDPASLTDQQRKWFASVREGLERDTGRSLETWVEIARTCPETKPRARLNWMKTVHGLGQNRASTVLAGAFHEPPSSGSSDADPLWAEPGPHTIFQAVEAVATGLDGVVTGRRKGYTAFSRRHQFAAVRPLKIGGVRLGLAVKAEEDPRLEAARHEGWSERLTAALNLPSPAALDDALASLVRQAWERS